MVSQWKGGRPRGPVRAATEEARILAVYLRERVDLSGKTYRQLAEEIYVSRTQISEFLGGKVPPEGFVLALLRATAAEQQPPGHADEKQALRLLADARRSLIKAPPGPALRPSPAPRTDPTMPLLPEPDWLRLIQRRMELEREVAALRSEKKRLKREQRHTRELNQVRELLARTEAARDQAEAGAQLALERQMAAERSAAHERGRARHLTQQLSMLGLSDVVPDNPGEVRDNQDNAAPEVPGPDNPLQRAAGPAQPAGTGFLGEHGTGAYAVRDEQTRLIRDCADRAPGTSGIFSTAGSEELKEMWAEASAAADAFRTGDAVRCYAELVVVQQRQLGAEHPDTLTARHNLAAWRGEAGDATGAATHFAELLPLRERVLGGDHPDTLATRHNLAHWQGAAGDAHGAVAGFASLLPDCLRVLGADHPDTLAVRHALAVWRGEAGDATGAAAALREVLRHQQRVLGSDHPDALATRSDLAQWQGVSGDVAGAVESFAALLPEALRVLGRDHMYTLIIRHNLAAWRGVSGDTSGAAAHLSELFPDTLRALGRQHPHTQAIRHHLAFWQRRSQT